MQKNTTISYAIILAFLVSVTLTQMAFAQVYPPQNSGMTVEQAIEKAKERVSLVKAHPGEGSGTPFLDANGVIGASIISGSVFGGIFVAFIWRAKKFEAISRAR